MKELLEWLIAIPIILMILVFKLAVIAIVFAFILAPLIFLGWIIWLIL